MKFFETAFFRLISAGSGFIITIILLRIEDISFVADYFEAFTYSRLLSVFLSFGAGIYVAQVSGEIVRNKEKFPWAAIIMIIARNLAAISPIFFLILYIFPESYHVVDFVAIFVFSLGVSFSTISSLMFNGVGASNVSVVTVGLLPNIGLLAYFWACYLIDHRFNIREASLSYFISSLFSVVFLFFFKENIGFGKWSEIRSVLSKLSPRKTFLNFLSELSVHFFYSSIIFLNTTFGSDQQVKTFGLMQRFGNIIGMLNSVAGTLMISQFSKLSVDEAFDKQPIYQTKISKYYIVGLVVFCVAFLAFWLPGAFGQSQLTLMIGFTMMSTLSVGFVISGRTLLSMHGFQAKVALANICAIIIASALLLFAHLGFLETYNWALIAYNVAISACVLLAYKRAVGQRTTLTK